MPAQSGTAYTTPGVDTRGGNNATVINPNQTVDTLGNAARQDMEVIIRMDATATLVAASVMTFNVQDSDDNSSFADITGLTNQTVHGTAVTNGNAQTDLRWSLPSFARRYIRAKCVADGSTGSNVASNFAIYLAT